MSRAGENECGFCERGRWHNPITNQRELCPYCDGTGYVNGGVDERAETNAVRGEGSGPCSKK